MASIRHLSRAPITEAVLEFRVRPNSTLTIDESVAKLRDEIRTWYPQAARMVTGIEVSSLKETERSENVIYRFDSEDEPWVLQTRVEAMVLSRLEPYTDWHDFTTEALRLWRIYEEIVKPVSLVRLSTRFINKIVLPPPVRLDEYFAFRPDVPNDLPETSHRFYTNIEVQGAEITTAITLALVELTTERAIFLFDTDSYKFIDDIEPPVPDELLKDTLEELHERKNLAFFRSLTERTIKLYE